jgi:hypothetical protein
MNAVTRFIAVQAIQLAATVLGWFVLIPFCLGRLWLADQQLRSIKDGRPIDDWDLPWLNFIYGNPEDGVSGQTALVWGPNGLEAYMPNAWAPWRAYCWSALRNSCDNLKYVFAWAEGPLWTYSFKVWRWTIRGKLGWQEENGYHVPVFSPFGA